jgi:hypothetical protein
MEDAVGARNFDLNIEKILEGWEIAHAMRELIANALDEQALTGTDDVSISQDTQGNWHIRDWGRGLTYKHLTENENSEKLQSPEKVIGKFGVGLKDALATLNRRGAAVRIRSKYGDFSLKEMPKHGFKDVVTLNVTVSEPTDPHFVGTEFVLSRVSSKDIEAAKHFFLKFSEEAVLEETRYGQILQRKSDRKARIYVTGLLVAEEDNFLFSYNITSLTSAMKRALNRERTNVGRTAYTERVKAMLLASQAAEVAQSLAEDLAKMQWGTNHDEVNWTDVAVHAGQVLSASTKVIFVAPHELGTTPTPVAGDAFPGELQGDEDGAGQPVDPSALGGIGLDEIESNRDSIDHAVAEGYRVIAVPDSVKQHLQGLTDLRGEPIRNIETYRQEWSKSFEFAFVEEGNLTRAEQQIFSLRGELAKLIGGLPAGVREIKVSETMRPDMGAVNAAGLWQPAVGRIIIRRSQLRSLEAFAGTLLHEITHARTGHTDLSRGFEEGLTAALGKVSARVLAARNHVIEPERSAKKAATVEGDEQVAVSKLSKNEVADLLWSDATSLKKVPKKLRRPWWKL